MGLRITINCQYCTLLTWSLACWPVENGVRMCWAMP